MINPQTLIAVIVFAVAMLVAFEGLQIFLHLWLIRKELNRPATAPKPPPKYLVKAWDDKNGQTLINSTIVENAKDSKEAIRNVAAMNGLENVKFVIHDWEAPERYSCAIGTFKTENQQVMIEATLVDDKIKKG